MKKIWKNYKQTIILLIALVVGAIIGLLAGEKAAVLSPFGDLFMNLLFVVIVPLIFLTITTSIAKIKQPKRLGKVILSTFGVFIVTSLIACLIGLAITYSIKLVNPSDTKAIIATLSDTVEETKEEMSILSRTVQAISVSDFKDIISKNSIVALVVMSILTGLAINKSGNADAFYGGGKTAGCSAVHTWAQSNGLIISGGEAKYGDLVLFGADEHIEIVVANNGDGSYTTIGGNTGSGDSGSQSNGGGVFMRTRYISGDFPITLFIRPPYSTD